MLCIPDFILTIAGAILELYVECMWILYIRDSAYKKVQKKTGYGRKMYVDFVYKSFCIQKAQIKTGYGRKMYVDFAHKKFHI